MHIFPQNEFARRGKKAALSFKLQLASHQGNYLSITNQPKWCGYDKILANCITAGRTAASLLVRDDDDDVLMGCAIHRAVLFFSFFVGIQCDAVLIPTNEHNATESVNSVIRGSFHS